MTIAARPPGIRLLVTGGTFDKAYNELTGQLFFMETHVEEMLRLGRCGLDIALHTLFMTDSLDMGEEHRQLVADSCKAAREDRIIITHGTDTMAETAAYLDAVVKDKTLVLTGAMIPYKFGSSDGLFNLGSALAFVQVLPAGVYIAMNGRYFPAGGVRKNKQAGVFETVYPGH